MKTFLGCYQGYQKVQVARSSQIYGSKGWIQEVKIYQSNWSVPYPEKS